MSNHHEVAARIHRSQATSLANSLIFQTGNWSLLLSFAKNGRYLGSQIKGFFPQSYPDISSWSVQWDPYPESVPLLFLVPVSGFWGPWDSDEPSICCKGLWSQVALNTNSMEIPWVAGFNRHGRSSPALPEIHLTAVGSSPMCPTLVLGSQRILFPTLTAIAPRSQIWNYPINSCNSNSPLERVKRKKGSLSSELLLLGRIKYWLLC